MLARLSRRLSVLTPALLGGLLWMGLPGAAEAGDWKHGRRHGHREQHYQKHHEHYGKHHYKHHRKHHYQDHGYSRGWRGYRHHPAWYGGYRGHRHLHHGVAFVDLPDLLVQTNFGFVFHR